MDSRQRLGAFAFVFAMASAAVGCSQEQNYCDSEACYLCDGLGCRRLDGPTRGSCDCDLECTQGLSCTSLGCTQACTGDAQCPASTRCRGGFCQTPREAAAASSGCSCTTDAQCTIAGTVCRAGACVIGCNEADDCTNGQACVNGLCTATQRPTCTTATEATDCGTGRLCVDGECVTDADACQFNSECGAGRVCVNQHCTSECDATRACPSGASCISGYCVEDTIGGGGSSCGATSSCAAGQVCRNSVCYDACSTDATCGAGRYCLEGVCRFDDRPRPSCGITQACASGSTCVNGSCRISCSTAPECARFDVQYNFCLDSLCATTNEATSNCASQSDCSGTAACVDGVCS